MVKKYEIKLVTNSADHLKSFDNDDTGHKHLLHECFVPWIIIIEIVNVTNGIFAQAFCRQFDFTTFLINPIFLGYKFVYTSSVLVEMQ